VWTRSRRCERSANRPAGVSLAWWPKDLNVRAEFETCLSDFCVTPIDLREIRQRLSLALQRDGKHLWERREFHGLILDPVNLEAVVRGLPVALNGTEYAMMVVFLAHPGVTVSPEELTDRVASLTGQERSVERITKDVHRLRDKIEADRHRPQWIRTVRGVGYVFEGRKVRTKHRS
jgi:DNA-binding response OmpR family regulator